LQLAAQQRELRAGALVRCLQSQAARREGLRLGARGGQLRGEGVGPTVHLGAALAQLAARAPEIGAGARHPDLLQADGLEPLPPLAERGPAGLDLRLDPPHLLVLVAVPLPGLDERAALLVAPRGEGDPPLPAA